MFFRSGYVKEELLRRLKNLRISQDQIQRVNEAILGVVDKKDCREFRRYCQLARKIGTPEFQRALRERLLSPDAGVRRRAQWVLDAMAT